jgi:hypothetical protein
VRSIPEENQACYEELLVPHFCDPQRSEMSERPVRELLRDPEKSGNFKHQHWETHNDIQRFTLARFWVKSENTLTAIHCEVFLPIGQVIWQKGSQAIRTWCLKKVRENDASDRRLQKCIRNLCV